MSKTVVLMASPRLQSNTDMLAEAVVEGIKGAGTGAETITKVDLVELGEFVCTACGHCREAGECIHFPEVTKVLRLIKEADGIVIATPTWWLGPSSYLKIFIDHWGTFLRMDYSSRIEGKKAVLVSCCGNPEVNFGEKVNKHLEEILALLGVTVVGSLAVKGAAGLGDVAGMPEALASARELGEKLYSE